MKVFIDSQFTKVEEQTTLLSLAILPENNKEGFYAINKDIDLGTLFNKEHLKDFFLGVYNLVEKEDIFNQYLDKNMIKEYNFETIRYIYDKVGKSMEEIVFNILAVISVYEKGLVKAEKYLNKLNITEKGDGEDILKEDMFKNLELISFDKTTSELCKVFLESMFKGGKLIDLSEELENYIQNNKDNLPKVQDISSFGNCIFIKELYVLNNKTNI